MWAAGHDKWVKERVHRQFDQLVSDINNGKLTPRLSLSRGSSETPAVWSFTSFFLRWTAEQIVSISPLLNTDLTDLYHQFSSCFHFPSLCSFPLLFAFSAQQMSCCPQPTSLKQQSCTLVDEQASKPVVHLTMLSPTTVGFSAPFLYFYLYCGGPPGGSTYTQWEGKWEE